MGRNMISEFFLRLNTGSQGMFGRNVPHAAPAAGLRKAAVVVDRTLTSARWLMTCWVDGNVRRRQSGRGGWRDQWTLSTAQRL